MGRALCLLLLVVACSGRPAHSHHGTSKSRSHGIPNLRSNLMMLEETKEQSLATDVADGFKVVKGGAKEVERDLKKLETAKLPQPNPKARLSKSAKFMGSVMSGAAVGAVTNTATALASGRGFKESLVNMAAGATVGALSSGAATGLALHTRNGKGIPVPAFKGNHILLSAGLGTAVGVLSQFGTGMSGVEDDVKSRVGAGVLGALAGHYIGSGDAIYAGDGELSCGELKAAFGGEAEISLEKFCKATHLPEDQANALFAKVGRSDHGNSILSADLCVYLDVDRSGFITLDNLLSHVFIRHGQEDLARAFMVKADTDDDKARGLVPAEREKISADEWDTREAAKAQAEADEEAAILNPPPEPVKTKNGKVTLNEFYTWLHRGRVDCPDAESCFVDATILSHSTLIPVSPSTPSDAVVEPEVQPLMSVEEAHAFLRHARSEMKRVGHDFGRQRQHMILTARANSLPGMPVTNGAVDQDSLTVKELFQFMACPACAPSEAPNFITVEAFLPLGGGSAENAATIFDAVDMSPSDPVTETSEDHAKHEQMLSYFETLTNDDVKNILIKAGYGEMEDGDISDMWTRFKESFTHQLGVKEEAKKKAIGDQGKIDMLRRAPALA